MTISNNNIFLMAKAAFQLPFPSKREITTKNTSLNPFDIIGNKPKSPFGDILDPLHPLHGGIGFTAASTPLNNVHRLIQATNSFKNISEKNTNIIHTSIVVNENEVYETALYAINGKNKITPMTKDNTSVYVSKFPLLNLMIHKEVQKLTGGNYDMLGMLNCVPKVKIFSSGQEDDFFCSQMILKAFKNALEKYQSIPLLPNKEEITKISKALEHLDPDVTMPAEIKDALDTIPEYFTIKKFDTAQ
jgi:hypothetical protein